MLPYWAVTVAPKATPDYFHRSDRISGPEAHHSPRRAAVGQMLWMSPGCPPAQVRLDLLFILLRPERSLDVAPHGLIGQTFDGSDVGVDGAVDPKPQLGEHVTTKAMAEGSIEGVWQDYVMPSPFATSFKFSRYNLTKAAPRNVTALTGRRFKFAATSTSTSATASHDEGTDEITEASRRRLEESCSPPSPPPPSPPLGANTDFAKCFPKYALLPWKEKFPEISPVRGLDLHQIP